MNESNTSNSSNCSYQHVDNKSEPIYIQNSISFDLSSTPSSKGNRFFPDNVVDILNKWFTDNQDYPYPDENTTNLLAKEANISAKQVRKWFANKRVRSNKCYKQSFHTKSTTGCKSRKKSKSVCENDMINNNHQLNSYLTCLNDTNKQMDTNNNDYQFRSYSLLYDQEEQDQIENETTYDDEEDEQQILNYKNNEEQFDIENNCIKSKRSLFYDTNDSKFFRPVLASSSSLSSSISSSSSLSSTLSNSSPTNMNSSYSSSWSHSSNLSTTSSPTTTYNNNNNEINQINVQDILYQYGNLIKNAQHHQQQQQQFEMNNHQQQSDIRMNYYYHQNSNQNQVNKIMNSFSSFYAPYLFANLLQRLNANQINEEQYQHHKVSELDTEQHAANNSSLFYKDLSIHTTSSSSLKTPERPVFGNTTSSSSETTTPSITIKRKTHLSNCFMNDSIKKVNYQYANEKENLKEEEEDEEENTKTCNNSKEPSKKAKINFGCIFDLIN